MRYKREHQRIERNARLRALRAMRWEERARQERAERDALKRRMIEYLGGACVRCTRTLEELGHPAAFDFHHKDWRSKTFNFAGNYGRRWEVLRAELDKCSLVCACCHRVIEATLEDPGRRRGRPRLPWPGVDGGNDAEGTRSLVEAARRRAERWEAERVSRGRNQLDLFAAGGSKCQRR